MEITINGNVTIRMNGEKIDEIASKITESQKIIYDILEEMKENSFEIDLLDKSVMSLMEQVTGETN